MIKLIASDMDGTLLDDEKRLPDGFFETLDMLEQRGIRFTVASGRTYAAAEYLFPPGYAAKMDFICDNGACVVHGGRTVSVTPLDREIYERLLSACEKIGGLKVLVCAAGGTYHLRAEDEFNAEIAKYYKKHIPCDDLRKIEDTIYKIAVCDELGTKERAKPAIDGIFGGSLNVQVSGKIWMDVMAGGVSKGAALERLQSFLGVSPEETMAFGDYYNDEDMLRRAAYSFAMENGSEDIKKMTRFIAESNNNGGVVRAIRRYLSGELE